MQAYGFEAPLEAALAYTPVLGSLIDLRRRSRSGFIAQDLLTLELHPGQVSMIPQCMIAPFRGVAEALGWIYVLERGSLVHRSVRGQLVARLPSVGDACTYLGAARAFEDSWDELGRTLESIAHVAAIEHQILSSAHDAFRRSADWFAAPQLQARGA